MSAQGHRRGWRRLMAPALAALPALAGWSARPAGAAGPPRRHVVEIRGMAFQPAVLEVAPGDTVVWVNRDIVPHTATAKRFWDTGTLAQGQSGSYVARRPGAISYACVLHPTMQGRLVVRQVAPATDGTR